MACPYEHVQTVLAKRMQSEVDGVPGLGMESDSSHHLRGEISLQNLATHWR